ncbi:cytochrome P450, putative [Ricinus communis]|uniref:Cytochrome P450, putative n=1 Tax=Ricinus communis TaxID=3988 RepID=B9RBW8_RICCO|nr:cytochrome P450, putative [Ricinus communis]
MDLLIVFLLVLAFAHALKFVVKGSKTTRGKLPPGPSPLPIIGNLFDLGDKPHRSLAKLAKIHGPLMSLKLGQITTVVISSSSLAKEVLQKHDLSFSNRTVVQAIQALDHHEASMPWLPVGAPWRNLRKICSFYIFTNQKLDANQDLRCKKIQELLADVQECCCAGAVVDIGEAAFKTMLNTLSSSVFSLDLTDSSSETVREFKEAVRGIMDELGRPNLADYFPTLRNIDPQGIKRRMRIYVGRMLDLFDHIIDERLQSRKEPGYIPANDMLDTLLSLDENNKEEMDRTRIKHLFVVGSRKLMLEAEILKLIPFGAGRRICPGLSLAMRMLHMMLGSLIVSFDWKLENGVTPESMDMEDKFGITLQKAQPLKAIPIQL